MLENFTAKLRNALEFWFTLSYHKLKLKLAKNPRKGVCLCCGKHAWTNIHHWCLSNDTLIFTKDGFDTIENLVNKNLRINVQTHTGNFNPIITTFSRTTKNLLSIKTIGCLPINCTPEHEFWTAQWAFKQSKKRLKEGKQGGSERTIVSYSWKKAKDLSEHDLVLIPKHKRQLHITKLGLDKLELTNETAWFFGYYMANGCSMPKYNKISIVVPLKRPEIANRIVSMLTQANINASIQFPKDKKAIIVYISSDCLSYFLKEQFGNDAITKQIPSFIFNNNNELIVQSFLKGYFAGDGHTVKHRGSVYLSTSNRILAIQLQKLMTSFNLFMNIQIRPEQTSTIRGQLVKSKKLYQVHSMTPNVAKFFNVEPYQGNRISKQNFELENYFGVAIRRIDQINKPTKVYNIGVANDESYTANNIAVHNCYRYTYTEIRQDWRLALKFTTELCYPCHDLGDRLRGLYNVDPDLQLKTRSKILNKLIELRKKALGSD